MTKKAVTKKSKKKVGPAPAPAPEPLTKKVEFELPAGATRGVFIYEVDGHPVPIVTGYGDIPVGVIYRLLVEAQANVQASMTADAVVNRLIGSMAPPPEMADEGLQMPESPHQEPVDDSEIN